MKWARAKTIFIFIFLFVNIFLFAVYRMNSGEGKQIDVKSVSTVLESHGLTADFKSFKSLRESVPQFEVGQLQSSENFGKSFFEAEATNENGKYTAGSETAIFNANGIEYKNSSPSPRGFSGINKHNAPSKIINFLEKRGLQKNILTADRVTENNNGSFTVTFTYSYNGGKILNQTLFVTASSNGVSEMKGQLLSFSEIKNGYYHTSPWETALLDFISYHGNEIFKEKTTLSGMQEGYYVSCDSSSLSAYALPAYKISIADGRVFYLDGRSNTEPEFILLENK